VSNDASAAACMQEIRQAHWAGVRSLGVKGLRAAALGAVIIAYFICCRRRSSKTASDDKGTAK
jgi:hypothetical protein